MPIEVSTLSYYNAENFPTCQTLPDYQDEFRKIDQLADAYQDALVVINDIDTRIDMGGRLIEAGCATTLTELRNRQTALRAYMDLLTNAFDACSRATTGCDIPAPGVPLSMPPIPSECGPTCATGPGATYAFDALGYCTRCRWSVGSTSVNHNSTGFANYCHFMRPTARVRGQLTSSPVYVEGNSMPGIYSWLEVYLDVQGDGTRTCPVPGGDNTCRFANALGFNYSISLSNHTRAVAGNASANIYAARCTTTGDRTCVFSNVALEICDESADESVGCSSF